MAVRMTHNAKCQLAITTYRNELRKLEEIDDELRELWKKGEFKRRRELIWSKWRTATQRKNRAATAVLRTAEERL
ncbi:MAG: hypothetical protein O6846_03945 [Thaumarchaeota archaeon]|nr:hypothetical protein [Nitrososphaerota archaeon]